MLSFRWCQVQNSLFCCSCAVLSPRPSLLGPCRSFPARYKPLGRGTPQRFSRPAKRSSHRLCAQYPPRPGLINLDLNLSHDFTFKPKSDKQKDVPTLTVFINSFNILNHPNCVTFVGVVASPFFGQPVAANPPRRTQLNLEFKF
jgi:hypothetical protein